MAKILTIDTGVQEYEINGAVVAFNGTDYRFAEQVTNTFDKMDALQTKYQARLQKSTGADTWKACREIDRDMRKVIDDLFGGEPVSDKIFGNISCYALAGGLPVWVNLLLAIIDEIDTTILEQTQATDPRLDAYLAKYKAREAASK